MKYYLQVKQVKEFVHVHENLLNQEPNNESIKIAAFTLFYNSFEESLPLIYEDPHPLTQFFSRLKQAYKNDSNKAQACIKQLEVWWHEWNFAIVMQTRVRRTIATDKASDIENNDHSHFAKLFAHIPIPICNVSLKTGQLIRVNQRFTDVLGYSVSDIPDMDTWFVKAFPDPEYRAYVHSFWQKAIAEKEFGHKTKSANNYCIHCKDGTNKMMDVSGIIIGDEYMAVLNDATERLQAQEILTGMAFLDSLTKIANRRRFDETLQFEFEQAKRQHTDLSLIMIDIDNFKLYNDRYGHLAGDKCLHDIAQQIAAEVCRTDDFVARYGGEEFAVLLPHTNHQGALFVAEQIQKTIEHLAIPHEDSFTNIVSLSMGISMLNSEVNSPSTLIESADAALYYAKAQGRNCIALSTQENSIMGNR